MPFIQICSGARCLLLLSEMRMGVRSAAVRQIHVVLGRFVIVVEIGRHVSRVLPDDGVNSLVVHNEIKHNEYRVKQE